MNIFKIFKRKKPESKEMTNLLNIPVDRWASIWCQLNSWELPSEIFNPNDLGFKICSQEHSDLIRPLMDKIRSTITHKECLREWNKDRMNNEEFESFWKENTISQ